MAAWKCITAALLVILRVRVGFLGRFAAAAAIGLAGQRPAFA